VSLFFDDFQPYVSDHKKLITDRTRILMLVESWRRVHDVSNHGIIEAIRGINTRHPCQALMGEIQLDEAMSFGALYQSGSFFICATINL
jgi:hypothetical protein